MNEPAHPSPGTLPQALLALASLLLALLTFAWRLSESLLRSFTVLDCLCATVLCLCAFAVTQWRAARKNAEVQQDLQNQLETLQREFNLQVGTNPDSLPIFERVVAIEEKLGLDAAKEPAPKDSEHGG